MNDPYSVLGVSHSATDEEVKKAYRDLARKYHPDNYANNPLADLAQDKMKEINEAYDQVMRQRESGSSGASGSSGSWTDAFRGARSSSGGNSYQEHSGSGKYPEIRAAITADRLDEAESMLNRITTRDAEWYFLRGSVYYKRGWMDEASRHLRQAVTMDPGNMEYREAVNIMQGSGTRYRSFGNRFAGANTGMRPCDCCTGLCCADCCCECFGGDLCPCC